MMRLSMSIRCVLVLSIVVIGGGCKREETRPPLKPNIVLITIDTLRADHLRCYGYFRNTSPKMDELASESILFERCLAPMATTLPAHMSLLTATDPLEHGVLANIQHGGARFVPSPKLRSFAETIRLDGYVTAAFVSATPVKRETGIAVGFDTFDQPEGRERRAGETNDAVFRWLDANPEQPFFLWVHYFDPHEPYVPPGPYNRLYHTDAGLEHHVAKRRFLDQQEIQPLRTENGRRRFNFYDGEIRYVDDQMGKLLSRLREGGMWDHTVVVLIGDHGEGLRQHGEANHGSIWHEQLHVPLMVRVPGCTPQRVSTALSITDVLPTVLGLMGRVRQDDFLRQAGGMDILVDDYAPRGVLSQDVERDRKKRTGVRYALTTAEWKYVHDVCGGDQLFNHVADPFELHNVLAAHTDMGNRLKTRLLKRIAEQTLRGKLLRDGGQLTEHPMDPKILEELKSLGYIP